MKTTGPKPAEEDTNQVIAKLKKQNKRLAALNIISSELSFVASDPSTVLSKSLEFILNTLGFDAGAAHLLNDQGVLSDAVAHIGLSKELLSWVNKECAAIRKGAGGKKWASPQALEFKKPVIVEDIKKTYSGEMLKVISEAGLSSIASIPIVHSNECLGLIMIGSKKGKELELFDVDFLGSIGKQIGIAISASSLTSKIITAKKEWEKTFDSIDNPISIHDKDFNVIRANIATAKFLNLPVKKIIGKKCYQLFHGSSKPIQGCPVARTINIWESTNLTIEDLKRKKTLLFAASPIIEENQLAGVIHTVRDITYQKVMTKKIMNASEQERRHISAEIHDSMLQLLYSASMYFKKAGLNKDAENPHLKEATALIDQAMDSGRKLIAGIRLPMIEDLGLYHSLREYVNGLFKNTGVKVYTEVNKKKIKKSEIDIVLYRIAQELLINVSKHSEAKNVNVKLFEYETELMLSVRDDGIGFKHDKIFFEEKAMSGHAGLQIAKEKCEMYSGQLLITSKPGFGTKVEVIMPKPFNRG